MNQVSLDQARFDMRVTDELTDAQVQDLIDRAGAIVADYLKVAEYTDDDQITIPVLNAVRLVAVSLFNDPSGTSDPLSPAVKNLLMRLRDPAVA